MMQFKDYNKKLQKHFDELQNNNKLFLVGISGEVLWDKYISSFPQQLQQEHVCNCCRSFIKHYGAIVVIDKDYKLKTIWDFEVTDEVFNNVNQEMRSLVLNTGTINDAFIQSYSTMGTEVSFQQKEDGVVTWYHFFTNLTSANSVYRGSKTVDSEKSEIRSRVQVFKRSLEELTKDSVETVLDLISQNSLYRGQEFKSMLSTFLTMKNKYDSLSIDQKDNFCWKEGAFDTFVSKIRNTSIGTLLIDISENVDLDVAVAKFERVMAPANYKRPTAIITKKMIEDAEKTIAELGFTDSLGRRFATRDDLSTENILFTNRDAKTASALGVFEELKESVPINVKTFNKVEEVSIDKFITDILPTCTSVEAFFENKHQGNLVSLISPQNAEAPSIFKWDNGFSWSYRDAVADSIKEKVKQAGGGVEGVLRVSLEWYNYDDLDLHIVEPGGNEIYYGRKRSPFTRGELDVDMNAGGRSSRTPVENIIYPDSSTLAKGDYRVFVRNFSKRENIDVGFTVQVETDGIIQDFVSPTSPPSRYDNGEKTVVILNYDGKMFKVVSSIDSKDIKVSSKTVWGVDTNKFHKVNVITNSPNHWTGNSVGNKHVFFILEGAVNDEDVRGFFNEFLPQNLLEHKRVFEALGSRMKVESTNKQLSGLGFSSTVRNDLIVKVDGKFSRTLKIKF